MKFSHSVFGVGEALNEYTTESGNVVVEIAFVDCVRAILKSALSPVADDATVAVKRAGIGSGRVKSTITTDDRLRPRKGFESA